MKTIGYYPGCSLAGGAVEFDLSIRAVARAAGVELREIEDWNCCGASAAHSLDHGLAVALPLRVLALAEEQGLLEVVAPCAACFSRLKGTQVRLKRNPKLAEAALALVERPCSGGVRILNINEFLSRLLQDGLGAKLPRPLKGVKAAAYYGCLLSRGDGVVEGDDHERPSAMDEAIRAAGCELVEWNFSTECCGGGFSMSLTDAVVRLSTDILADARAAGADAVVVGCPMCHSNLDMRQLKIAPAALDGRPIPVLYITELLGLAAGLDPATLGLDRHFIDAAAVAGPAAP